MMDDWVDDWEAEIPQSSRAGMGKSKTFDGLDDIVADEDFLGESSSMPKAKKLKKVGAVKKSKAKKGKLPCVNPDEPVRDTWIGVKPSLIKKARLEFNPYVFPQSTCLDDPRFYCKVHQQIFHERLAIHKNNHAKVEYFNLIQCREEWPLVMDIMEFHQISKIMTVNTPYSPDLIQQFYATVVFTKERGKKTLTWMSADTKCSSTLADFGALFGLEELPFCPMYVRLHLQKLLPAESAIRHCYPPGIGLRDKIPNVTHMYHFWRMVYTILRNCLASKVGEKVLVHERMVNLLHHIYDLYLRKKRIDVLDYLWEEMQVVVVKCRTPIYCSLLQTLINKKLPEEVVMSYELYSPPLVGLRALPEGAPVFPPPSDAPDVDDDSQHKGGLVEALKRMNCFFAHKRKSEYKAYTKQKAASRHNRAIMDKLGVAYSASSAEVSENTYMAQNKYTYWFGDDASSLAPYWQGGVPGQSSSGAAAHDAEIDATDDDEEDDEDEDE